MDRVILFVILMCGVLNYCCTVMYLLCDYVLCYYGQNCTVMNCIVLFYELCNLYINLACLSVCLFVWVSVCLYPTIKTAEPIGPKFLWDIWGLREGLWMIKFSNICLHQNSIVIKVFKILKIHEIFCENPRIIFVLFYDVHKENMFTII